ncbi:MAG: TolC family protein [bacterium]|nr:TolC family protein [bacterium]
MKIKMPILAFMAVWLVTLTASIAANDRWQSGLESNGSGQMEKSSVLTFADVLKRVAANNPLLRSVSFRNEAAANRLEQAGLKSNPEFSAEIEEVGWNAPGFSESELTISLSQEIDIFGKRKARKNVASVEYQSTDFSGKVRAFDLYIDTRNRFNKLLHAQRFAVLAASSVRLAENIVEGLEYRVSRGVTLRSDLLLAQLELQRIILTDEEAQQELAGARLALAALWNSSSVDFTLFAPEEPDLQPVRRKLPTLLKQIDSTRIVRESQYDKDILQAGIALAEAEAKPTLTLGGGFKRLQLDNSKSFLFGVSIPLPLFNRNQGEIAALKASLNSKEYEQAQARTETMAYIRMTTARLDQLFSRHIALDTLLLPIAERAYASLEETHKVGRLPYTTLLEAERSLIELRFEHNDVLFEINEQLVALEQITGIKMHDQ